MKRSRKEADLLEGDPRADTKGTGKEPQADTAEPAELEVKWQNMALTLLDTHLLEYPMGAKAWHETIIRDFVKDNAIKATLVKIRVPAHSTVDGDVKEHISVNIRLGPVELKTKDPNTGNQVSTWHIYTKRDKGPIFAPPEGKKGKAKKPKDEANKPKDGANKPKDGANKPKDGANKPKDGANKPKGPLKK